MSFDNALTKSVKQTPQSQPVTGREEEMVKNPAGGYVFKTDPMEYLMRFLLIGTEGGTYYVKEQKLTLENVQHVLAMIKQDGALVAKTVHEVSVLGRAPKNDQALFVLAMVVAYGDETAKELALEYLPYVARTATHLFQFVDFLKSMRGFGRSIKRSLSNWYLGKEVDDLAYQMVKYRQRGGWTHRDVLRLAHPVCHDPEKDLLLNWAVDPDIAYMSQKEALKKGKHFELPKLVRAFLQLERAKTEDDAVKALREHKSLSHEMVPTEVKGAKVWKQLLSNLPMTALIRNLPTLTRLEVFKPMSDEEQGIVKRLTDPEALKKARVHPINLLIASNTYQHGKSLRGSSEWTPLPAISEALEQAFYAAFHGLPEIPKRVYIGLDVSGSMFWGHLMGVPGFSPAVAGAALTLCLQKQCERSVIRGFSDNMIHLGFKPSTSLKEAHALIDDLPFGRTDCALPMIDALSHKWEVDAFIVITDNETWYGQIHPVKALEEYRRKMGINSKLVVVGMEASNFTIADPSDPGMLDVVGFDASMPVAIQEFLK